MVDTQAPHRHSDGEYGARRRGCEEAARQLGVRALRDVGTGDLESALARVESDEQLEYLQILGCDRAQGYLFAPPVPPEEFLERSDGISSRAAPPPPKGSLAVHPCATARRSPRNVAR